MCEANTYNPYDGSTNCLQCPLQQITSAPGASRCDRAVEGYYVPDPTAVNPVAKKCPRHASCAGGHFLPSPKKGFWSDPTSSTSAAAKIYECTRDTCTGAKGNHSCWTATNMDTEGCNIDDILCKRGSEGRKLRCATLSSLSSCAILLQSRSLFLGASQHFVGVVLLILASIKYLPTASIAEGR
jgi:hypothetical protein